jgi:hypothetical protein
VPLDGTKSRVRSGEASDGKEATCQIIGLDVFIKN